VLFLLDWAAARQAAAWLARVWVVQAVAAAWLRRPLGFAQCFSALTYASGPACVRFLPVVGLLAEVWMLATSTVALHALLGVPPARAAALALAGAAGALAVGGLLGYLLGALL
jgi:hypothetical protein